MGVPVYPLPDRPDGSAPDGKDLPAFAEKLAKKGCKDILIFLAGHGDEFGTGGVNVAWDEASNTSRKVTPVNLRDTLHFNPKTTFKIVIDSCYSGKFVKWLPASFKNLLVLSVSSSATEVLFSGGVKTVIGADGQATTTPTPRRRESRTRRAVSSRTSQPVGGPLPNHRPPSRPPRPPAGRSSRT